jgi:ferredoxin-type protein NapH
MVSIVKKTKFQQFILKLLPHRLWVQAAFLLVWLNPLAIRVHTICGPVFHCYACPLATFACPIGIIAQFSALQIFPFMAAGILILTGAVLGSLICGWVCPFGLLQDLAAKIPTPRLKIPSWMGNVRYLVLFGSVLLIPYFFGENHPLFICRICPAGGLEKAVPDMITAAIGGNPIPWPNAIKLTITITFVIAIFFTIRPWCLVLCPLGVIFGFFNRFSIFSMTLDDKKCTQCGHCRTLCTYGSQPDKDPNSDTCLRCLECTQCGPQALQASTVFDADKTDLPEKEKSPQQ